MELNDNDETAVAAVMARVAALPGRARTPDPLPPWWKAQLLRRWDAERRAQLPLDLMQPIEMAAAVGAAAFLLFLSLPYLF